MAGITAIGFALPFSAVAEIVHREGAVVTVIEVGSATLGEPQDRDVKELAKNDAIRKAIELAVGVHITVKTSIKNFELAEDTIGAYSRVYIKSIREIEYKFDAASRTGTYRGEFVIDGSTMAGLAEAERALAERRFHPVQATIFFFDGQGRMIQDQSTVRAGDRFNVMIQPFGDVYAYIVGRDSKGNMFTVFPNKDVSVHENPLRKDVQYFFPPRKSTQIFAFDGNPGKEFFHFLLSAAPLPDMDALFKKLRELRTPAEQRALTPIIEERIATRGISLQTKPQSVSWKPGNEKFEVALGEVLKGTGAVVKTIALNHIR